MEQCETDDACELTYIKPSAEELRRRFCALLKVLGTTENELAHAMHRLGDYRKPSTIVRGLQRMRSGETGVSGEMMVVLRQLMREQQRLKDYKPNLEWKQLPDGSWTSRTEDFTISLAPQTRQRWRVQLVHIESGYSPPWPAWQKSLAAAKAKAVECVFEARQQMSDWACDESLNQV